MKTIWYFAIGIPVCILIAIAGIEQPIHFKNGVVVSSSRTFGGLQVDVDTTADGVADLIGKATGTGDLYSLYNRGDSVSVEVWRFTGNSVTLLDSVQKNPRDPLSK